MLMNVLKIETAAETACVPTPRAATSVPVTRAMNSPPTNLLVWVSTLFHSFSFVIDVLVWLIFVRL